MNNNLTKLCKKAAEIIHSYPKETRIRVISHYDADGISAASIICKALYRAGYDFHATLMRNPFDKGLERVSKEDNKLVIYSDMGSGQIETIEKMDFKSIIIDHHQPLKKKTKDNVLQINCNHFDINGNYEACGSTLSYCFAKELDKKNSDLAALAIVGATGDKQYIGGFRGLNKEIIDEALKNKIVDEKTGIKLPGENIYESLFYSIDPYYSGISGNKKNIEDLLDKLKIKKEDSFEKLNPDQIKKLNSYLMLTLIKNGCEKNILDTIIRKRYYTKIFDFESERFADLLDSCGKSGNRGIGFSVALGDKKSLDDAINIEKEYKEKILNELLRLEKEGFKEKNGFRYFYTENSSIGGVIGGIATNFMLDIKKPLISIVRKNSEIHVSCRGNQDLVKRGLDLGVAMKKTSEKLGGHGGGHAIASGATIDSDKEKDFLEFVDNIIVNQIK
jgi:RecJ-like exonuclease